MRRLLRKVPTLFLGPILMLALYGTVAITPARAQVSIGISVGFPPPDLPVYEQPQCPGDNYIWTPGYWAWDGYDYYWVPGTWVLAPQPGYLWTPGYWAWRDNAYFWTAGYWGPVVGFYGGVNYGYGYFGHGYDGGRWDRGHFFYNRSVNNVNVTVIRNTYNTTVVNRNVTVNRVSFNGGRGGIEAHASAQEEAAARERHIGMVKAQTRHVEDARRDSALRASQNHGLPPVAATAKPGDFKRSTVRATEAGTVHPRPATPNNKPSGPPGHARDLPPAARNNPPNTGNPKLDQKHAQQQQKLEQKQAQDRQKLEQRQQRDDQKIQQQRMNDAKRQQMEQRHQQQTQKMVQRQQQQTQKMQQRQAPRPAPAPKPAPKPAQHPPH